MQNNMIKDVSNARSMGIIYIPEEIRNLALSNTIFSSKLNHAFKHTYAINGVLVEPDGTVGPVNRQKWFYFKSLGRNLHYNRMVLNRIYVMSKNLTTFVILQPQYLLSEIFETIRDYVLELSLIDNFRIFWADYSNVD